MSATFISRHIVADARICHGQPTFRGTRIMVWQVHEQLAQGMSWEAIVDAWGGRISRDAIEEAVRMANKAFAQHAQEYAIEVPAG